jgi:2-C-methyl-D-erythritol 4-phosphate cytidylyltransferase
MVKYITILPTSGFGSRFGSNIPKQYAKINNRYLIEYTLNAFLDVPIIDDLYIIVNHHDLYIDEIINKYSHYNKNKIKILRCGGKTRSETVFNSLNNIIANEHDWILVHDVVRCYIKPELIIKQINELKNCTSGGILAIPVRDTVKIVEGQKIFKTLNRNNIYLAQTPQMFRYGILLDSYNNIENFNDMTDEASIVEASKYDVLFVLGDEENIKVTYENDIRMFEKYI